MEELIFAGILLLSQASPGPDQAFVTRSTLAYGFGAGVMAALGIGTGVVAHAALACTVGASVFHSPLGLALFCLASCWMLYLAWKIWPRGGKPSVPAGDSLPPASSIYRDALLTNLMNPKATFFFVALSSPLLEKNHSVSYAFFIGMLIVVTGTVGWILWALVFRWHPIRIFMIAMPIGWTPPCPWRLPDSASACCTPSGVWLWKVFRNEGKKGCKGFFAGK